VLSAHVPGLDALELLVAIGRTGSLARAGAERGVSQAAVSMRLRSVESQVGVRLVERGPTGSRLTPEGALLADWAQEVLRAAAGLDAGITALREGQGSHLRVASSLTIAENLLPGWLSSLRDARPATAVSLSAVNSTAVAELVLTRAAELGFVEGPTVPVGLSTRVVGSDERGGCAGSRRAPARRAQRPVTATELATMALVEREAGSGTRAALDAALRTQPPRPTPLLEVSSTTALRAAVIAGVGPAVTSSLAVGDDVTDGRLVVVPVSDVDLRRRLRAVWVRGSTLLHAGRDLLAIAGRAPTRSRGGDEAGADEASTRATAGPPR